MKLTLFFNQSISCRTKVNDEVVKMLDANGDKVRPATALKAQHVFMLLLLTNVSRAASDLREPYNELHQLHTCPIFTELQKYDRSRMFACWLCALAFAQHQ